MLERVRNAIIAPQKLIKYRNDRMLYIIAYMMFFALLMTTGPVLRTYQSIHLTPSVQANIRDSFSFPASECSIEDAVLKCAEEKAHVVYEEAFFGLPFTIVLEGRDHYDKDNYEGHHIVFFEDQVYVALDQLFVDRTLLVQPIDQLHQSIHNISFNPEGEAEKAAFYDAIFETVSEELGIFRVMISLSRFIVEFFSGMLLILVFVLLNSFLVQRQLSKVPFKQMFAMIAYASTLAYVVLAFYNLVLFNIFVFLILLFIAFRQTSRLAFEIQRRIYKS